MPDLWMDVDTALSEVPVNIMPLLDDTDFKTRETAIAFNAAGMDLVWNFVTTAGAFTQTAVTPTSAGNYDWTNQGDGMYTIEIPASGGASINNDTEGFGWFSGFVTGVLPFRGPTIGFRAAALNNSLVDGTTIDVNAVALSGDTTAADNAESFFDGTGYAGTNNVIPTVTNVTNLHASAATAAALATVDGNVDSILVDTNELQTDWTNGGRLDLIIDAILADTNELQSDDVPGLIAALNNLSAAQVNAEVDTALADIHLDHLLAVTYDPATKPGAADALLNELVESDVGVSRFTQNALEQGPGGGDGSGFTAIPWNAAWDAEVESEVTDALTAYDPPTNAEMEARTLAAAAYFDPAADTVANVTNVATVAALATDSVNAAALAADALVEINAEIDTALGDYDGPTRAELTSDINSVLAQLPSDVPVEGTADSGSTTTMVDAALTQGDDYWTDSWILFTSGTLNGVCRLITGFTAATDTITFAPASPAAVSTHTYRIIPAAQISETLVLTGHTPQTGDNYARLGAPAGVSVSADIAENQTDLNAILADTNELQTDWVDGGRLDLIVDAILADTGELQTDDVPGLIAALNNLSAAEVNAEVDTALADIHLDHLLAVDYDPASKPGIATALLNELVESDAGVSRFTSNALEQGPGGGDGSGFTAIPWNSAWDAEVQSEAADALTAYDPPTYDELLAFIQLLARSDAAIATDRSTELSAINANEGSGAGDYASTSESQEAIRDRGDSAWITGAGGTPPQLLQNTTIATLASQTSFTLTAGSADNDAYNDALIIVTDQSTSTQKAVGIISDYAGATQTITLAADPGIFTMAVGDTVDIIAVAPGTTAPTVEQIRTEIDTNSTQLAAIVADTNELQTDWVNGGRLDLIVDAILDDTNELQTDDVPGLIAALNNLSAAQVNAEVDTALADIHLDHLLATDYDPAIKPGVATALLNELVESDVGVSRFTANALEQAPDTAGPSAAAIRTEIDANSTQLAAIVADTNELQTDWANGGRLDLILDARASQATADAIETDTQDIQSRLPAALVSGRMSSDAVAISGSTDAADKLEASAETIVIGTAATGTLSTTQMTSNLSELTNDHYSGRIIIWATGALAGQATDITNYAGANGLLTFTAVTEAPSNGDIFVIV